MLEPKRNLSDKGLDVLKQVEGFKSKAYKDVAGKWTIAYGHLIVPGDGVVIGEIIDEYKATSLLRNDVAAAVSAVNALVTNNKINQNQFDALVLFTYNVGRGALQSSTLLKLLNGNVMDLVPNEFGKWNKIRNEKGELVASNGLTNRRRVEKDLFVSKE